MDKIDKKIEFYTCKRCGHKWTNRKEWNVHEGQIPYVCPKCHKYTWNVDKL